MISLIEVYLSSRQELRWFEAQKGVLTMAGHLMRLKIHASWCPPFKRSSQQKQAERKEIPLLSASWKRSQHRLWDGCSAAPPVAMAISDALASDGDELVSEDKSIPGGGDVNRDE